MKKKEKYRYLEDVFVKKFNKITLFALITLCVASCGLEARWNSLIRHLRLFARPALYTVYSPSMIHPYAYFPRYKKISDVPGALDPLNPKTTEKENDDLDPFVGDLGGEVNVDDFDGDPDDFGGDFGDFGGDFGDSDDF